MYFMQVSVIEKDGLKGQTAVSRGPTSANESISQQRRDTLPISQIPSPTELSTLP